MTQELLDKVAEAARLTGIAQADIMRLAIQMGLEDLRRINYDIARCVSDTAHAISKQHPDIPQIIDIPEQKVAESPDTSPSAKAPRNSVAYPAKKRPRLRCLDRQLRR